MHNEFEHEDDDWRPEKPKLVRVIGKIFKIAVLCFVVGIILLVTVRLIRSYSPRSMKEMVWNGSALEAYLTDSDNFEVRYYSSTDSFSDDNMFSISQITYIPSIGQYQATVRYNKRVLNYLRADYGIDELPEGEVYVFMLRDNHGNVYKDYEYTSVSRSDYEYRHVIFDGVSMDDVTFLTLEAYYIGDVSSGKARAEMYMYRYDYPDSEYFYGTPPSEPNGGVHSKPEHVDNVP